MNEKAMIELFGGKYRYRVLRQLYQAPEQSYHLRGLAEATGASSGTLLTLLRKLCKTGFVERQNARPYPIYRAATSNPLFADLVRLFRRDSDTVQVVRHALTPLKDRIEYAAIFGSFARGEETSTSDVDVLVIGAVGAIKVQAALHAAEAVAMRPVNAATYSRAAFSRMIEEKNAFALDVIAQPKILLLGTEDALENRRRAA